MPVVIKSLCSLDMAQNSDFVVLVDGQVRQYGNQSDVAYNAEFLLGQLMDSPQDYYQKLAGFFSAIIFDKQQGIVSLISDHIGSKSLYYTLHQDRLTITDSLDLLDAEQKTLNPQGIFNYCFYHCIAAPTTIYKEVFKVEAGQCVELSKLGRISSQVLYQPTYDYSSEPREVLHKQCRSLIAQAVKRHISTDCGAFLSGGLDSSTVAGVLAKNTNPARTFSIGFESKQFDESFYARLTSRHFNTEHHCHVMQPNELIDNFRSVAGYFDQPFGNSSAMAAYSCATFAKEHGVAILMAGDGGDEIFAGNERYAKQTAFEHFNNAPIAIQKLLNGLFCATPLGKLPLGSKAASYINQAKTPLPDRLDNYNFLNRFALEQIFSAKFLSQIDPQQPVEQKRKRFSQAQSDSDLERMLFLDWKFTLADNDLVKVSQMCAMAGVEVCYPLLEKELVDFSCQIDPSEKLKGNDLRYFFKQAVTGFLADKTLTKEKHGFGLPFGLWMSESEELMTMATETLAAMAKRDIFNLDFIELALEKHQSEHSNYYGELVWIVVVLELWLESRGL